MDYRFTAENLETIFGEDLDLTVTGPDSTRYEGKELAPTQEHLKVVDGKAGESYDSFLYKELVSINCK